MRSFVVRAGVAVFVLGSSLLGGCGGVHDAMRPDQPAAAQATGHAQLKAVDGPSTPLVIDWQPEQRADLEEAVHDGVAIVRWDERGMALLKRCRLAGSYGYLPVQTKRDVVRLETADDVKANLPLGGAGIASTIGGGFAQGTTLDIALAIVGKRRTTWNDVSRDDMTGACDGATHYIRAITVGAFAMRTGSRAKAAVAAQIFGAGLSAGTGSDKNVQSQDGKLDACEAATGEETKPPGQCAAVLRLELEPLSKGGGTKAPAPAATPTTKPPTKTPEVAAEVVEGCPAGFVFTEGACKTAATVADRPHACVPTEPEDCDAQCTKGDAASCDRVGSLILAGKVGAPDPERASVAFQKSCDGGYASGCANLGIRLAVGAKPDPAKAAAALQKGCALGSARACGVMGDAALTGAFGAKDPALALKYLVKGCDGGNYSACTNAGFLYAGGTTAVARDDAKALEYGKRACFGGEPVACGNAGYKIELGESVAPNPALALALYDRGCRLDASECFRNGLLLATGNGAVAKDDAKAKPLLEKACASGRSLASVACVVAAKMYGSTGAASPAALTTTVSSMKVQCDQKEGRACAFLGIAELGQGKAADAATHLKASCDLKDPLGCAAAKLK